MIEKGKPQKVAKEKEDKWGLERGGAPKEKSKLCAFIFSSSHFDNNF